MELSVPGRPPVGARLDEPSGPAVATYVFAHGAGAPMTHPFMEAMTTRLVARGVATLRFNFPYMEAGARRPDPAPVLQAAVVAACALARHLAPDRPLFAGGKSMGGRMTSQALAQGALPEDVAGLIFLGFPLHPARRPGRERARHLADVPTPMLFVQGDRDTLADLRLLVPVVEGLGPRARLHVVRGGDHGLQVLVRSGRTHAEALDEAADAVRTFIDEVAGG